MRNLSSEETMDGKVLVTLQDDPDRGRSYLLGCTARQYAMGWRAYQDGTLIQEAFHFLTADEREFLLTGMTPDEWDRLLGESEAP